MAARSTILGILLFLACLLVGAPVTFQYYQDKRELEHHIPGVEFVFYARLDLTAAELDTLVQEACEVYAESWEQELARDGANMMETSIPGEVETPVPGTVDCHPRAMGHEPDLPDMWYWPVNVFARNGKFEEHNGELIPWGSNFKQVYVIFHELPRRPVIYIADDSYTTMSPELNFSGTVREVERDLAGSLISTLMDRGAILGRVDY